MVKKRHFNSTCDEIHKHTQTIGSIVHYSNAPNRRVEFLISVSYDCDVETVRSVLLGLLTQHELVLDEEGFPYGKEKKP